MTRAKTPTPEHDELPKKAKLCDSAMREAFRRVIGPNPHPAVVMRALEGDPKIRRAVDEAYQQIMDEREAAREQAELEEDN